MYIQYYIYTSLFGVLENSLLQASELSFVLPALSPASSVIPSMGENTGKSPPGVKTNDEVAGFVSSVVRIPPTFVRIICGEGEE